MCVFFLFVIYLFFNYPFSLSLSPFLPLILPLSLTMYTRNVLFVGVWLANIFVCFFYRRSSIHLGLRHPVEHILIILGYIQKVCFITNRRNYGREGVYHPVIFKYSLYNLDNDKEFNLIFRYFLLFGFFQHDYLQSVCCCNYFLFFFLSSFWPEVVSSSLCICYIRRFPLSHPK